MVVGSWGAARLGRPSTARLPSLLLAVIPIALVHLLIGMQTGGAATPAEAAAVTGIGAGTLAPADVAFVGQLTAVAALVGPDGAVTLLELARGVCLLAGLLAALLLWPVACRLQLGADAAAAAVLVAGVVPLVAGLQPTVDPGSVSVFWFVAAAVCGVRLRITGLTVVGAGAGVAAAVLTAPLVAVGLLAFVAHGFAGGLLAPSRSRGQRMTAAAVAVAMAAVVAALAIGRTPVGGPGEVPVGGPASLVVIGAGAVVVLLAWRWRPELRPVATMAAAWLGCALWPGPARLTALLLAVPVLALLCAAVVGDAADRTPDRSWRVPVAAAGAVVVSAVTAAAMIVGLVALPDRQTYGPLARWLQGELDPGTVLAAAPLDRAELIAAGVPDQRFAGGAPSSVGAWVVSDAAGCGPAGTPVVTVPSAGGQLGVCLAAGPPAVAADMAGAGPLLAGNGALRLDDAARQALLAGRVDGRLVAVLVAAATTRRIEVIDFPAVAGEPDGALRRTAVLAGVGPSGDEVGRSSMVEFLQAQRPPFRPEVSTVDGGGLVVHFRVAGPGVAG